MSFDEIVVVAGPVLDKLKLPLREGTADKYIEVIAIGAACAGHAELARTIAPGPNAYIRCRLLAMALIHGVAGAAASGDYPTAVSFLFGHATCDALIKDAYLSSDVPGDVIFTGSGSFRFLSDDAVRNKARSVWPSVRQALTFIEKQEMFFTGMFDEHGDLMRSATAIGQLALFPFDDAPVADCLMYVWQQLTSLAETAAEFVAAAEVAQWRLLRPVCIEREYREDIISRFFDRFVFSCDTIDDAVVALHALWPMVMAFEHDWSFALDTGPPPPVTVDAALDHLIASECLTKRSIIARGVILENPIWAPLCRRMIDGIDPDDANHHWRLVSSKRNKALARAMLEAGYRPWLHWLDGGPGANDVNGAMDLETAAWVHWVTGQMLEVQGRGDAKDVY